MFAHDAVRRHDVSTSEKVGGVYSSLAFFCVATLLQPAFLQITECVDAPVAEKRPMRSCGVDE